MASKKHENVFSQLCSHQFWGSFGLDLATFYQVKKIILQLMPQSTIASVTVVYQ